jgi:Uma2 family endonuclease
MTDEERRTEALERLRTASWTLPPGWKFNREELYEERLSRLSLDERGRLSRERFRKLYADHKPAFELIDGIPEQKAVATVEHSSLQVVLGVMLGELGFRSLMELTLAISESWELIPDVVGELGPKPEGPYPTEPVAVAVEILSSDPFLRLIDKCRKYAEWGIPDILVLDPVRRLGWRWDKAVDGMVPLRDLYHFSSRPGAGLSLPELFQREAERWESKDNSRGHCLYESDFHLWCLEQARLLRELRYSKEVGTLDVEHVAEEMESLALQEREQLRDYVAALVAYRLDYDYQRAYRTREKDWLAQIILQQDNIQRWLKQSPSLRAFGADSVEDAYCAARIFAGTLTEGAIEYDFPSRCPYTFEQLMERDQPETQEKK